MRMCRRLTIFAKKLLLWLYNSSGGNTEITGGLKGYAYKPSYSNSSAGYVPSVVEDGSSVTVTVPNSSSYATYGSYFVENAIDLTGYKTMKMEVLEASTTVSSSSDSMSIRMGVTATKANNYNSAADTIIVSNGEKITETTVFSLDISSLNGSYYLMIDMHGWRKKSIKFSRWWLE